MRKIILSSLLFCCLIISAQRTEFLLEKDWKFSKGDYNEASQIDFDDSKWETVRIPHDWAIYGPFNRQNDLQNVAIEQNLEKQKSVKTGRTGGLPYVGVGWYRTHFDASADRKVTLVFDGAMSEARVFVNGKEACFWPYGYNSFFCDVTGLLNQSGKNNVLSVRLENKPQSSRWYPGAGLYRNVHVVQTDIVHIPVWGTQVITPFVSDSLASVQLLSTIEGVGENDIRVLTEIYSSEGKKVSQSDDTRKVNHERVFEQNFVVEQPILWSPEHPYLYKAVSRIYKEGKKVDEYTTSFGIRSIQIVPDKGFYLNGKRRKFQGVCLHHDLGPLGAAINESAIRHQLVMLKDMGCDAIRTAHNMPTPELVKLCDEMGFMMMLEPFDEWDIAKCKNGYHRFFDEWAEKDMINMLHQYRNHPSVVMWSIGNEVPTQCNNKGYEVATFLQDICHREDPGRPVTCGMDQISCVLDNGFAALLDVPGFNYRVHRYEEAYKRLPQKVILGSETSSTVSSRGVYKIPVEIKADAKYADHQSSSYDMEYCSWSNLPDADLALSDDKEWTMGQFVWTGFDYLGEPSPYDTDAWPNHSSLFGIIDLASIPKDRYYLYKSIWNKTENTLHILPHWTWNGKEGEKIPVYVYTNYYCAEIFVNGKSYGKQYRSNESLQHRYRLMWNDVVYDPGELKVVAYDKNGNAVDEAAVHTAGKPHHLELSVDHDTLMSNGKDLAYVTVNVVDKDGKLCPHDGRLIHFTVSGAANYRAAANGDPTCLDLFHLPHMHAFSGQLTAIVESTEQPGNAIFQAKAKGLKGAKIMIKIK